MEDSVKGYGVKIIEDESLLSWDDVEKAPIGVYKWAITEEYPAYFSMVYIRGYGFKCKMACREAKPLTVYRQDRDPVYKDSAMEAFISFSEAGYINLETNSAGARLQGWGPGRPDRAQVFDIVEGGFEVEAGREGEEWTLVISLPLDKLKHIFEGLGEEELVPGYCFKGNFYKIGTDPEHYGMWNEVMTETPDYHRPEYFGTLKLV